MAIIKDMTDKSEGIRLHFLRIAQMGNAFRTQNKTLSLLFHKVWMVPQKCRWSHTAFVERILLNSRDAPMLK